jgi:hypothetical protein
MGGGISEGAGKEASSPTEPSPRIGAQQSSSECQREGIIGSVWGQKGDFRGHRPSAGGARADDQSRARSSVPPHPRHSRG